MPSHAHACPVALCSKRAHDTAFTAHTPHACASCFAPKSVAWRLLVGRGFFARITSMSSHNAPLPHNSTSLAPHPTSSPHRSPPVPAPRRRHFKELLKKQKPGYNYTQASLQSMIKPRPVRCTPLLPLLNDQHVGRIGVYTLQPWCLTHCTPPAAERACTRHALSPLSPLST